MLSKLLPDRLVARCIALTDTGRQRRRNEDRILALSDVGLFAVADGMGGVSGGAEASKLVMESLEHTAVTGKCDPDSISKALYMANSRILQMGRDGGMEGMGSTVAVLCVNPKRSRATVIHAGDSRVYRFQHGRLAQLTEDHSVVAELKKRIQAETGSQHMPSISLIEGQLTQAVGLANELSLSRQMFKVSPGDVYMLCSDGLNKHVSDEQIANALRHSAAEHDLMNVAAKLVRMANDNGGTDNISVVLVRLERARDFTRKVGLLVVCTAVAICAGAVLVTQDAKRKEKKIKTRIERFMRTKISLTLDELDEQRRRYGEMESLPEGQRKQLVTTLVARNEKFVQEYRARAEKAVIGRDWRCLESLPILDRSDFPFRPDKLAQRIIDFSKDKGELHGLWWRLRRSIAKRQFDEIANRSRRYAEITGPITDKDPVGVIARAVLSKGTDLKMAEALLKVWPFDDTEKELRDSLSRFVAKLTDGASPTRGPSTAVNDE